MLSTDRMIISDNGTLKDASVKLNNFKSSNGYAHAFVVAEDYLFIGSEFPFNHKYFDMVQSNVNVTTIAEIAVWDGDEWKACVDVIDETSGLTSHGYVKFTVDKNFGWSRDDTVYSSGTEKITGLGGITIYDMYWVRIKFGGADMSAATQISYIGPKFSDSDFMSIEYPTLNTTSAKTQFQASKTNWEEQEFLAAILIIEDLKRKKVILGAGQILEREAFAIPSVHKVAEIIYKEYGEDWEDKRKRAREYYNEAMKGLFQFIDQNNNARHDLTEKLGSVGFLKR